MFPGVKFSPSKCYLKKRIGSVCLQNMYQYFQFSMCPSIRKMLEFASIYWFNFLVHVFIGLAFVNVGGELAWDATKGSILKSGLHDLNIYIYIHMYMYIYIHTYYKCYIIFVGVKRSAINLQNIGSIESLESMFFVQLFSRSHGLIKEHHEKSIVDHGWSWSIACTWLLLSYVIFCFFRWWTRAIFTMIPRLAVGLWIPVSTSE